jgi:hypothetical protein
VLKRIRLFQTNQSKLDKELLDRPADNRLRQKSERQTSGQIEEDYGRIIPSERGDGKALPECVKGEACNVCSLGRDLEGVSLLHDVVGHLRGVLEDVAVVRRGEGFIHQQIKREDGDVSTLERTRRNGEED